MRTSGVISEKTLGKWKTLGKKRRGASDVVLGA